MTEKARQPAPFRIGVVADDLTGALDTGAGLARAGLRVRVPLGAVDAALDVADIDAVVINTATREGDAATARDRSRDATRALLRAGVTVLYKKVDSVMRGHPGPELAGMLSVLPAGTRAVVAPAFPAQGRVTVDGVQLVHGQPATHHGGVLAEAFASAADACDFRDAATDDDLLAVATQGIEDGVRVWVGTAGLAAQLVPALIEKGLHFAAHDGADDDDDDPWHGGRPVVVIAGSVHPVTVAQVAALAASGAAHLAIDLRRPEAWPDAETLDHAIAAPGVTIISTHGGVPEGVLSADLARNALALLDRVADALGRRLVSAETPPALVVTGGETAQRLFGRLGATAIDVTGEVLPGIPTGRVHVGSVVARVVTKSGGFGAVGDLLTIVTGSPA